MPATQKGKKWTAKEIATLKRDHNLLTIKEIAKKLNRTPAGVAWKLQDLKTNPKRYNVKVTTTRKPVDHTPRKRSFLDRLFGTK